ncbi:uncharacterized protein LOC113232474 [Hyposmocoma kahamanoa]|uniref:uncharacterized protein LOC113232474 n=1 Tax=Hyposmocoma kahamanoa TaxID=1477025 RepID=UPI000E6D8D13|nr:uncharacterized protein LOC113232474 [Hyposmocoma kahamanoa]
MAYLLKAGRSPQKYDAWICGGAIVSPSFIVTSAACVEDVQFMYAVAGTVHYVNTGRLAEDKCTRALAKRVVLSCVPKSYEFSYDNIEKWSYIDIAAVKVESPYNFSLTIPTPECKHLPENEIWIPDRIYINYEAKFQNPGTDALVLGWGHSSKWREPSDPTDHNEKLLQYASTLIQNKTQCKKYYRNLTDLQATIDKYMICTLAKGNIDDQGHLIVTEKSNVDGCSDNDKKAGRCKLERLGPPPPPIPIPSIYDFDDVYVDFRRSIPNNTRITRRHGICQNDHGGPLVTWIGAHEVLIGVASVFRISHELECIGPYLYTSTQCNGQFLQCVIDDNTEHEHDTDDDDSRRKQKDVCNMAPAERGFDIIERRISWKHHPDGPAENELKEEIFERPQIPLHNLYNRF